MKFSKSWGEEPESTPTSTGYIRYFKNPETTFRVLQDPTDWLSYWEHFNPSGYPFPCTGDRTSCPGCTSDNEKMKKAQRRVAINVLEGEYVNVYKFPKTLAEKLETRAERIGTVTDRDYTIFKTQKTNGDGSTRTDYDLEGGDKIPVDLSKLELKDVEAMLLAAYEQSWGDSDLVQQTQERATEEQQLSVLKKAVPKDPPFEKVYSEAELRSMTPHDLLITMEKEGIDGPEGADKMTPDQLVDWLVEQ